MSKRKQYISFTIIFFFLITPLNTSLSQTESIEQAFQKALKNMEAERVKEQEELVSKLKLKLDLATEDWISSLSKNKELELDKIIQQHWEKIPKTTSPSYYDYYLRYYAYLVTKTDIIKTDSLIAPYKAYINLMEKLYVERYHTPDVSDRNRFLYTVTTPITINLEYREDKFIVTNREYSNLSIKQGWPEEVKRKLILR